MSQAATKRKAQCKAPEHWNPSCCAGSENYRKTVAAQAGEFDVDLDDFEEKEFQCVFCRANLGRIRGVKIVSGHYKGAVIDICFIDLDEGPAA